MRLEVRLLGSPSLASDGSPVRLHSAKTLALLTYLSVESGRVHSREKLAGLLWGESSEARARQSLRQALYSLRHTLPADALDSDATTVHLPPHPDVWTDEAAFRDLVAMSQRSPRPDVLKRAADTYRGTLLEGHEPTGCPGFAEWLFFQRDRLEQQALAVLETLVDHLASAGAPDAALAYADRLLGLDPLNERAFRRLMSLHGAAGDRDAVRRLYQRCADSLSRELGVEPDAETHALFERLMADRSAAAAPARVARDQDHAKDRLVVLPFLGRAREMDQLEEQYRLASAGQGRLVLVSGEAGIGKTRLVDAFLAKVAGTPSAPPQLALSGRCYEAESNTPYTVWADALQTLAQPESRTRLDGLADVWRRQLGRVLPDLGPGPAQSGAMTPDESRLLLTQGVVRTLQHLAARGPILVWLDDLHWADGASLATLSYAARHLSGYPALLIGTYRPGAARDNQALRALERGSPRPIRIEVAPLGENAVDEIVASLAARTDRDLTARLLQHCDGNPLVLTEAVQVLQDTPERERHGIALHQQTSTWPVPDRIYELIQSRLANLPVLTQRVLGACAVLGRPYGIVLLRRVSGVTETDAIEAVEQAIGRGFLQERPDADSPPTIAFRHSYYRRVVYEGLSTVQRESLHVRAARALKEAYQSTPEVVVEQVADHLDWGRDPQAAGYLARAARQAAALYADRHATYLYTRAIAALNAHQPTDSDTLFGLVRDRERLLDRQGLRAEQEADVTQLKHLAEELEDATLLALALVREAGFLSAVGRHDEAHDAGEQALKIYRRAGDTGGEGQALRELGYASWSSGDYRAALAYMRHALELHRRLGDTEGEATALHNLAEVHRSLGSPRQAIRLYEDVLRLYWSRQDRERQSISLYGLANAYRDAGDDEQALSHLAEALSLCEAAGDRLLASRVHHTMAGLRQAQGNDAGARQAMELAVTLSREMGYGPGLAHSLIALSDLYARTGRHDDAEAARAEADGWLDLIEGGPEQGPLVNRSPDLVDPIEPVDTDGRTGWVRTHVRLAEGKVYCAFESPVGRAGSCRRVREAHQQIRPGHSDWKNPA